MCYVLSYVLSYVLRAAHICLLWSFVIAVADNCHAAPLSSPAAAG